MWARWQVYSDNALGFECEMRSLCVTTGSSAGLDGSNDLDRKKGSHLGKNQRKQGKGRA